MVELLILLVGPAAGGAVVHHLWSTRPARRRHSGLAVGQIPGRLRRRTMAVRRVGGAA